MNIHKDDYVFYEFQSLVIESYVIYSKFDASNKQYKNHYGNFGFYHLVGFSKVTQKSDYEDMQLIKQFL